MNIQELGDKIAALSPGPDGDARALRMLLKDKFGIEAPGGDGPTQQQQKQLEPESAPVATEFNVVYTGFDPAKKMNAIKSVRDLLGLGLIEAKSLVEGGEKVLKESLDAKAADELKKKLEEGGAKIEVRPV